MEVEILARVRPSEDVEKVVDAIKKLFPDARVRKEGTLVYATITWEELLSAVRKEGIEPRFRALLRSRKRGKSVVIPIDKQAATAGRISFDEDDPMWVEIRGDVDV